MTATLADQLVGAIESKDSRMNDVLRALYEQPDALPHAQQAVAQLLAGYIAKEQDSDFAAALAVLENYPALLEKVKPETVIQAMSWQLREGNYRNFGKTIDGFKNTAALSAGTIAETLARRVNAFLRYDQARDVAETLKTLAARHPPLYSRVQHAAAQHGLFLRSPSDMLRDSEGQSYYLALKVGSDAVELSCGCRMKRNLADLLHYWATAPRALTLDRRALVIPMVMQLLDEAATSRAAPPAFRATAARARDAARIQLAGYGLDYYPSRSDRSRHGSAGAVKEGLGLGAAG